MDYFENSKKVISKIRPSSRPHAKIIAPEKRKRLNDRRKLHTYLADDLRKGLADRRRHHAQNPSFRRRDFEDRRRTYTYLADDRRSGIADRRNRRRFLPPWWRMVVSGLH